MNKIIPEILQINSVVDAFVRVKKAKQKVNQSKRKLKTEVDKHRCVFDLLEYKTHDKATEAACAIFVIMGIGQVTNEDKSGNEDIRIVLDKDVFILEVGTDMAQSKTHQTDKHKPSVQKNYPNYSIHGGAIIKPKGNQAKFDNKTVRLAIENRNILFTVNELALTYIAFLNNEINSDQIIEKMKQHGVFRVKET